MARGGVSTKRFESKKKNGISLRNDELLDTHFKPIKIGDKLAPVELSTEALRTSLLKCDKLETNDWNEIQYDMLDGETIQLRNTENNGGFALSSAAGSLSLYSRNANSSKEGADDPVYAQFNSPETAVTSPAEILTLTNWFNTSATMTGTGPAIAFNQAYYVFGGGTTDDTGQLGFFCQQNWTATASTRDSSFEVKNSLNGSLQTCFKVSASLHTSLYGDASIPADNKLFLGTTANNDYIYSDDDDIYLAKDDTDIWVFKDSVTTTEVPLLIKESAEATSDLSGYGQIWVDTATPNELAFTDDAGTDIIGIGKYHYETKFIGYNATATGVYLPITGYVFETTTTAGRNENISFIAPYNGTIQKLALRSEIAQDGNINMRVFESSDGTEIPGANIFRQDTTVDIADDVYQELSMTSPSVGSDYSPLTKGRIYNIFINTPSASNDTNVTVVFKWDITS